MKTRCKHRVVLLICILLLGQEFARAKTLHNEPIEADQLPVNKRLFDSEIDDDDDSLGSDDDEEQTGSGSGSASGEEDDLPSFSSRPHLVSQRPVDECSGKRGWINIGSVFKALKIGSKIASYAASAFSLSTSIYLAVEGCAGVYPDAQKYHDKFLNQSNITKAIGKEADDIQFGAQLDQSYVESTADIYGKILCKLNEMDTESDTMLQSMSPDVLAASLNASERIKDLIEEKNRTMEKITYIEVDGLYRSALENSLSISVPALAIALPLGYELFKFAKKRYSQRKVGVMQTDNNVDFELPPTTNKKLFTDTKFGKWIGTKQQRFKEVLINLKRKFNISFTKIKNVAKLFMGGLEIAGGFAFAAYQAYETIKTLKDDCRRVMENAREAYNKALEATNKINSTLTMIREHKKAMDETWSNMRKNLTEDMFLDSVRTAKTVMENSAIQNQATQAIISAMSDFLDRINTTDDHRITHDLSRDLYSNSLIKIPFAFICYKNKINMMNNIINDCKEGYYSLDKLVTKQRDRFDESLDDPESPRACRDNMGIDYVTDEQIKASWFKYAELNGHHRVCYMNDPTKRESFCKKYREEDMTAEEISAAYNNKYPVEDIQELLDLLPEEKILKRYQRFTICSLRDEGQTNEEIKKSFLFKTVPLEKIVATKCPDEGCVPNNLLPPIEREDGEDEGD